MEELFYPLGIVFIIVSASLGVGIGCSQVAMSAITALNIAPLIKTEMLKIVLFALALIETGGIISLILALLLIFGQPFEHNQYALIAQLGICLAMGISSFIVGIVSAWPGSAAALALARQPFFGTKILNVMLLSQSIIQTPVIFSFLICLIIKAQLSNVAHITQAVTLLVAGLAMGIGSIGPAIGISRFARVALQCLGINRNAYNKILSFSFISQAMIETPIIFVMLIALIICLTPIASDNYIPMFTYSIAALCMALSSFAPSLSSSKIASAGCLQIAYNAEKSTAASRMSILSQGLVDSAAIYGLLIALLLILMS